VGIHYLQLQALNIVSGIISFTLLSYAFYSFLQLLPQRKQRWRKQRLRRMAAPDNRLRNLVRYCLLLRADDPQHERRQLLQGSGFKLEVLQYETIRRMLVLIFSLLVGLLVLAYPYPAVSLYISPTLPLAVLASILLLLLADRLSLQFLSKQRAQRIIKEVYAISNQLLYYADSEMNLHTKLTRCLPYTKTIRSDLHDMLNEWYQDAEAAIQHFKSRLGSDEGYSFAETLNSLRLNESQSYYELLRQRIHDYKEKLELAKESRKETTSYLLFVIAGIPIFYTFRVFIYPWVVEGQKLFDSLG
jgi:hypothetical protein